jgi:hypothetical protein
LNAVKGAFGETFPDRTKRFEEGFLGMLNEHRIEYDPRYVFEQEMVE